MDCSPLVLLVSRLEDFVAEARSAIEVTIGFGSCFTRLIQAEEAGSGPLGAGDNSGNPAERPVPGSRMEEVAVLDDDDLMGLSLPFAQQTGTGLVVIPDASRERLAMTPSGMRAVCFQRKMPA